MNFLIRTLLDPDLDPEEIMKAHNIYPCVTDLEPGSEAFVYRSRKGRYYISKRQILPTLLGCGSKHKRTPTESSKG